MTGSNFIAEVFYVQYIHNIQGFPLFISEGTQPKVTGEFSVVNSSQFILYFYMVEIVLKITIGTKAQKTQNCSLKTTKEKS